MAVAPGLRQWIPVPTGWVGRMRRDPLRFLSEVRERYGDVMRLHTGPWRFHLVTHPDHVRHVLLDHQKDYPRSWLYDRTKVAAGSGLVTTEGAAWRRLRRMAQPAFHHDRVAALVGVMADEADALRRRWLDRAAGPGGSFHTELSREFETLALRVVGRALLGTDLADTTEALGPPVTALLSYTLYRLNNRLAPPPWVPTSRNLRFTRALRSFDALIAGILARRRSAPGDGRVHDLLAMLLDVRDEETGAGLGDRELRDQVVTFLVARYETTAIGLTWAIYLLTRHPEARERVRAEVESVLGDRTPTAADLPRLAFTRRVFDEALRLYPPVYAVARDAARADSIGGFDILARSVVILSPYVTHRHPGFWPDPEAFDPDRFTPERSAGASPLRLVPVPRRPAPVHRPGVRRVRGRRRDRHGRPLVPPDAPPRRGRRAGARAHAAAPRRDRHAGRTRLIGDSRASGRRGPRSAAAGSGLGGPGSQGSITAARIAPDQSAAGTYTRSSSDRSRSTTSGRSAARSHVSARSLSRS